MTPPITPEAIGCNGIDWHKDTVWKRCNRAETCARYIHRRELRAPVDKLCRLDEREHYWEEL